MGAMKYLRFTIFILTAALLTVTHFPNSVSAASNSTNALSNRLALSDQVKDCLSTLRELQAERPSKPVSAVKNWEQKYNKLSAQCAKLQDQIRQ